MTPPPAGRAALRPLLAYGCLRMPLALLELPLFVLLPALYGGTLGVPLAVVGGTLFAARLLDALADPLLGGWMARRRGGGYLRWIRLALLPLAAGFALLLHPPLPAAPSPSQAALWLGAASLMAYLAYSAVTIAYQSWGAELGGDPGERARVTGTREVFGLLGVVGAAALLAPEHATSLAATFAALCLACAWLLRFAPAPSGSVAAPARPHARGPDTTATATRVVPGPDAGTVAIDTAGVTARTPDDDAGTASEAPPPAVRPMRARAFRWLLAAFMINGVASAIPATLVLFYLRDVLRAESLAGGFLLAYFAAGAAGMPLWVTLARRIGLRNAWLVGMACAVIAFVWTLEFDAGDLGPYLAVVLLTGFTLGADLALPPALLAGVVEGAGARRRGEAAFFGWWNLATKLNLALAAGLALPLLEWSGYVPGSGGTTLPLVLIYAGLPCVLKLVAAVVLWIAPLEDDEMMWT